MEHKSIGSPAHILRHRWKDPASQAFQCLAGAKAACQSGNFDHARNLTRQAEATLVTYQRPDLLSEVRIIDRLIEYNSEQVRNHKSKAQRKVEGMLEEAETLAYMLNLERAIELYTEADRTTHKEKLAKKGRLKARFVKTSEGLQCAESVIEGDLQLDLAWTAIQTDELNDAFRYLQDAAKFYGGIAMRAQELRRCEQAYQIKRDSEHRIREKGDGLMQKAREEMDARKFEEAADTIENARKSYSTWLVAIGRNQSLVEKLTMMLQKTWNNRSLYEMFCAHDVANLSGQGSRAYTMDFNEMLHLLRALGILAVKQASVAAEEAAILPMSLSKAEQQLRQQQMSMVDLCTFEEIRNDPLCKVTKADIHDEFRSVNRMSIQQALQGNEEADSDASSLDWSEFQLLMLRIGRLLGVAVTDQACSPLFVKDVREADDLKDELAALKKEYIQGIIHQGEKIMMQARNLMQDKQFDEARAAIQQAQNEFMRIQDDTIQRINVSSCRRLSEQVDKEEKKEMTRRADQRTIADHSLAHALAILDEYDHLGSRFDEHLFDVVEREADNARKLFKNAQAYTSDKKEMYIEIGKRCQNARDGIVMLRKLVVQGRDELDSGKSLLLHNQDAKGTQSTPPAFDTILAHLRTARENFLKAKVSEEAEEAAEALRNLKAMSLAWVRNHVDAAETYLRVSEQALSEALAASETDATLVEDKHSAARNNFREAAKVLQRAKLAQCMVAYLTEVGDTAALKADMFRDAWAEAVRSKIDDQDGKWKEQRAKELKEAFEEVDSCRKCISKAEFLQARDHLQRIRSLFKKQEANVLRDITQEIKQAESADKSRAHAVREEGITHMAEAGKARATGRYADALSLVERSRKCFMSARDDALEKEAATLHADVLKELRAKYVGQVEDAAFLLQQAEQASEGLRFNDATAFLSRAKALLYDDSCRGVLVIKESPEECPEDETVKAAYAHHDELKGALERLKTLVSHKEHVYTANSNLRAHLGACLARVIQEYTGERASLSAREVSSVNARCELAHALSMSRHSDSGSAHSAHNIAPTHQPKDANNDGTECGSQGTPAGGVRKTFSPADIQGMLTDVKASVCALKARQQEEVATALALVESLLQQASIAIGVPREQAMEMNVDFAQWVANVVEKAEEIGIKRAADTMNAAANMPSGDMETEQTDAEGVDEPRVDGGSVEEEWTEHLLSKI